MPGTLISIDAWNRAAVARVTVRAGRSRNSATLGASGFTWEPAIRRAPRFSMQLADDDLTGAVQVGQAEFALKVPMIRRAGDPRNLDFAGAAVRIYSGDGNDLNRMRQEFVGRIYAGVPDANTGIASFQVEADRTIVDVPLLTRTYTGGGGAEGDPELRGNNKPAGFGSPINVPAILINAVASIYQVDGYGNLQGIGGVYEDLASFGAFHANYGSYAALAAAAIPEGSWASCLADGLFRLGAPATGTITCDPVCGGGLPGSMMLRWLQEHAGVTGARIRVSDFGQLTAAVQAVVGAPPTVSFWTTDNSNVLELMQRMCASCNAVPLLLLDGTIGVARCVGGPQALTLQRRGGTPPVSAWQSSDAPVPWWRMRMTAARSVYVNNASEIDYEDDIRLLGNYTPGQTYRQGDVVLAGDGARYLFVNPTPTANVAPPNAAYWTIYEDAPDASTIRYTSGSTLQDKEPQEAGANVTETRRAQYILNQGAFATTDTAAFGSPLLTGFGNLAGLPSLSFGSPYLLESAGGASATLAAFKTALGTAQYFANQGLLATLSSLANGGPFLTGFGLLSQRDYVKIGGGSEGANSWTLFTNLGFPTTDNSVLTYLGTAAYIANQGWGATASEASASNARVTLGSNVLVNSSFARGLYAFRKGDFDGASSEFGLNLPGYFGRRQVAYVHGFNGATGAYTDVCSFGPWAGGSVDEMRRLALPVKLGDRIAVRTAVATHRCNAQLFILFFSADGTLVDAPNTNVGSIEGGASNGDSMGDMSLVSTIGSDQITHCCWMLRQVCNGGVQPYLFFTEPFMAKIGATQDVVPPYAPGPADPVSDRTADNTAQFVANQGALATLSSLGFGGPFLTGFGALAGKTYAKIGTPGPDTGQLLTENGFATSDAQLITGIGTARYLFAQGVLATRDTVSYAADLTGIPGRLGPSPQHGDEYLEASRVAYSQGETAQSFRPQEAGANVTEGRTARYLYGQGFLATESYVEWGVRFSGAPGYVTDPATQGGQQGIQSGYVFYSNSYTTRSLFTYFPEDILSNRTEDRTARYIVGQGRGATANSLADLDPAAAARLGYAAANGGSGETVALGNPIVRDVPNGSAVTINAGAFVNAGGAAGSLFVRVGVSIDDVGFYGNIDGSATSIGPGEPGFSSVDNFVFTNTTGEQRRFRFVAAAVRSPGNAGGAVDDRQSYLAI